MAVVILALIGSGCLMGILYFLVKSVKKAAIIALTDPDNRGYEMLSDKVLHRFVIGACITMFIITTLSFGLLLYGIILIWFYFIFFWTRFFRVWKAHGKSRLDLVILTIVMVIGSLAVSPFTRTFLLFIVRQCVSLYNQHIIYAV